MKNLRMLETSLANAPAGHKLAVQENVQTTKVLTFNVSRLGADFFTPPISERVINLVIHELGHESGMHTESSYHETLTDLAGKLIITALKEPQFYGED